MKKVLKKFLFFLLEKIESYQYRNLELDPNNVEKKIIEEHDLDNIFVLSDTGYSPISKIYLTQPYQHIEIKTENCRIECADLHILFDSNYNEIYADELIIGDKIMTKNGPEEIIEINYLNKFLSMFDISVNDENHRYYSNDILSHNTINAAIFILHFITFNADKNVMIAANKYDTVKEIIDKINSIYVQLPFFLKAGIRNKNQKTLTFGDTGCRIKSTARSKEAAVGFSIDLLYLDEFAHIPKNIINPFYRAIYPTVSAIQNSKIIVTSTPNGFNLFHDILSKAELPEGHPLKNSYKAMRVYYDQVPGRNATFVKFNNLKLEKLGLNAHTIYDKIKQLWNPNDIKVNNGLDMTELTYDEKDAKDIVKIQNTTDLSVNDIRKETFTFTIKGKEKKITLPMVAEVYSWKEQAIKDIGSEESFNQEFNLQFITGSKLLFDKAHLKLFKSREKEFKYFEIDQFTERMSIEYKELRFIDDKEIFDIENAKNYYMAFSVDVGEGLGLDYTVINMFKLTHKPVEEIKNHVYSSASDYFRLEQVGVYQCNLMGPEEVAEVLYMLTNNLFDPERCKVTLELNGPGSELLAFMPNVFGGNNDYGTFIFSRFKHRANDKKRKIGLKVNKNKALMVQQYQKRLNKSDVVVYDKESIKEIKNFIKDETNAGNIKFAAETGHDDIAMTIVLVSSKFMSSVDFKNMVEEYMSYDLDEDIRLLIEKQMGMNEYIEEADYSSLKNARNNNLPSRRKELPPPRRGFRN